MRHLTLLLLTLLFAASCGKQERSVEDFNFDWHFTLGDSPQFSQSNFDHSSWRSLRLPHDWAIESQFSADNPSTPGGGALPGGIGWYRKTFTVPDLEKIVNLEFDGVFMNSTVWVNGQQVGHRPYGYSSFSYDITPHLHPGENVVAVRCDNSEQPNSRWYAGCGIYRNVRLVSTAPVFVEYSGTFVTTPEVSNTHCSVQIATNVTNKDKVAHKVTLTHKIYNSADQCVAKVSSESQIEAGASILLPATTSIENPERWDTQNPHLYTLHTTIQSDNGARDNYKTRFGVRTFRFDTSRGFILNDRSVKLLGVCMHHDLGALGAAVHPRAIERQLEILRQMGCNAIRTAHNPPTPELLDMCDSMGFLVMDEALDMWRKRKTTYDYSRFFDQWHEKDVTDFIRRDRNHPSIIAWSIGNEILEQWNSDDDSGELAAEQANLLMNFRSDLPPQVASEMNPNVLMTIRLADMVRQIDSTRPITAGCNEPGPHNNLLRSGTLDLIGYNYHETYYDSVARWFPNKPLVGSETASSLQSRGFYINPSTTQIVEPKHWSEVYNTPHHQCSAYDHSRTPWGALHEQAWIAIRDRDFVSGTFVWTGFDYLGEPTPYSWPSRSSYFGIVDLAGFPKDVYNMYRAEWTDQTTLHLFPHWNWAEGDKIDLWAYYNNADQVELLVNGVSRGRKSKTANQLHCIWEQVPFQEGEITAVSYKDGAEVARHTRKTASEAVALRLTADRDRLAADGYDLSFIRVEALDRQGNPHPTAAHSLKFEVLGAGELVGVDNGDPTSHLSMKGDTMPLFNGLALGIVRTFRGQKGEIELKVSCGELQQTIKLEAR